MLGTSQFKVKDAACFLSFGAIFLECVFEKVAAWKCLPSPTAAVKNPLGGFKQSSLDYRSVPGG